MNSWTRICTYWIEATKPTNCFFQWTDSHRFDSFFALSLANRFPISRFLPCVLTNHSLDEEFWLVCEGMHWEKKVSLLENIIVKSIEERNFCSRLQAPPSLHLGGLFIKWRQTLENVFLKNSVVHIYQRACLINQPKLSILNARNFEIKTYAEV